jgi:isopenicillin N synthase-like dioxygenase
MLHLETIDLAQIVAGDSHERQKLKEAATRPGGFLLDFKNTDEAIVDAVSRLYDLSDRYFQRPSEVKLKDVREDIPSSSDRG